MKQQLKSFFIAIVLISTVSVGLQAAEKQKSHVVTIQTSAICGSCKARLEKVLKDSEGVEEAVLNLNNKKVKIKYDPAKTNPDKLRAVIVNAGYNADNLTRNEEAYGKLPACCQKPMEGDKH